MTDSTQEPQYKYQQIRDELVQLIEAMKPGCKLDSEREFSRKFNCSFLTVRKAMQMLVEEGLVVRRMGSGTFVSEQGVALSAGGKNKVESFKDSKCHVGVLIHTSGDSYAKQSLAALHQAALTKGVELCCRVIFSFGRQALEQIDELQKEGCDSVILPWFPSTNSSEAAELVYRSPLPISLPVTLPGLEKYAFQVPESFGQNLVHGIENLGKYLLKIGWKQVAFLGPDRPDDSLILQRNLLGYNNFICENGLSNLTGLVKPTADSINVIAKKWYSQAGALGVICYDDEHAFRFLMAINKLSLAVPDDFGVVSFGNSRIAQVTEPPLTCAYHNSEHPAHWMLRNALALAKDETDQAQQEATLHLAIRQSCGGRVQLGEGLLEVAQNTGFDPVMTEIGTAVSK